MAILSVRDFAGTAEILGTVREFRYEHCNERLMIEAVSSSDAMVILEALAASGVHGLGPSKEEDAIVRIATQVKCGDGSMVVNKDLSCPGAKIRAQPPAVPLVPVAVEPAVAPAPEQEQEDEKRPKPNAEKRPAPKPKVEKPEPKVVKQPEPKSEPKTDRKPEPKTAELADRKITPARRRGSKPKKPPTVADDIGTPIEGQSFPVVEMAVALAEQHKANEVLATVPKEVLASKNLREFVSGLYESGIKDPKDIVAKCLSLKEDVRLLGRVRNLEDRVRRAIMVCRIPEAEESRNSEQGK